MDLCRLNVFMSEPKHNYRLINAMVQQLYRRAMPENMRLHSFSGK
ncbi:MAG: hypothetical protein V7752_16020 [Halopseudomonas sp.]